MNADYVRQLSDWLEIEKQLQAECTPGSLGWEFHRGKRETFEECLGAFKRSVPTKSKRDIALTTLLLGILFVAGLIGYGSGKSVADHWWEQNWLGHCQWMEQNFGRFPPNHPRHP